MKVSQDQLTKLYRFTRTHYVAHYDVQTELVDHLANGIEYQWKENGNLSFEEALHREFKKFGVFGFHDLIAQKQNAMNKKYRAILWRFFKEWFRWPKIIGTFFSACAIFLILRYLNAYKIKPMLIVGALLLVSLGVLGYLFWSRASRELKMVQWGRKYMLGEMIYNFGNSAIVAIFLANAANFLYIFNSSIYYTVLFDAVCTATLVSFSLILYSVLWVLPAKAEALLAETYPELRQATAVTNV
ncbi:hypothetical protein U1E44_11080 [Arenibacter sp. GZD96]|uniref:hypothetical protein n=1 Tax=Aurantibrevibacter litoralis TaxID=3106030 RepID=UPI002AFDFDD1|nr:hypothetical protein [Arenibacter sp. GZD-96]MEA1786637.1 hypothetical protein [Arenibacter sp. GZD-96]